MSGLEKTPRGRSSERAKRTGIPICEPECASDGQLSGGAQATFLSYMNIPPYLKRRLRRSVSSPLGVLTDRLLLFDHTWLRHSPWPIHGAAQQGYYKPFFIIANPRSGTTLLRAILAQHPAVFIPPENGALGQMIGTFSTCRARPWHVVVDAVLNVFRRGYEFSHWRLDLAALKHAAEALPVEERTLARLIHLLYYTYGSIHAPEKTQWGDKTVSGNVLYCERIDLVFPEARYIHIVRDGRDCVASALKAGMFSNDYLYAAYSWKCNVRKCRRFGKKLKAQNRFFEFRYEDLISTPAQVVSAVCDFLAIQPTEAMLHYTGMVDHMADVQTIPHHQNVARPIFRDSMGSWQRQLPPPTLHSVMKIIGSELTAWGYK